MFGSGDFVSLLSPSSSHLLVLQDPNKSPLTGRFLVISKGRPLLKVRSVLRRTEEEGSF